MVLPFLVIKLFKLKFKAVKNFIEVLRFSFDFSASFFSLVYGLESFIIVPSSILTILVEYFSASSGLCVTIITSLSFDIFFNISITCTEVWVSKAPVGSSAKIISGLFTKALAIATLCICPPDNWFGFLCICSFNPTSSNALIAFCLRSFLLTPDKVSANSTFASTVWCGIKL